VQCKSIMSAVCFDGSLKSKVMVSRRDVQTNGLETGHRDPLQNQGWNWNLNPHLTCYLWFYMSPLLYQ